MNSSNNYSSVSYALLSGNLRELIAVGTFLPIFPSQDAKQFQCVHVDAFFSTQGWFEWEIGRYQGSIHHLRWSDLECKTHISSPYLSWWCFCFSSFAQIHIFLPAPAIPTHWMHSNHFLNAFDCLRSTCFVCVVIFFFVARKMIDGKRVMSYKFRINCSRSCDDKARIVAGGGVVVAVSNAKCGKKIGQRWIYRK